MKQIREASRRFDVNRLFTFGSASTGDFTTGSDVDFLVSFDHSVSPVELSENIFATRHRIEILDRKVDLVMERSLNNPFLINSINKTKEKIYDRSGEEVSLWY